MSRDLFLSFPILILCLLYWYTRLTSAGLHSSSVFLFAGSIIAHFIHFIYVGAKSKTAGWEAFVFLLVMSVFDIFQAWIMIKLVLPFELVWGDWVPVGIRRTGWTKRERITRRQEKSVVNWVQCVAVCSSLNWDSQ